MGLNNRRMTTTTGEALFDGKDLLKMGDRELRQIRGNDIAMIFQDPMTSLNPVHTVGRQLVEAIRLHRDVSKKQAQARALELLKAVGIPRAERRIEDYPHQFSGGMRQRVMIAMALVNEPDLLIADEPTTALDVTTQAQILSLMNSLQREFGSAIVLITHDLGVVAEVADEVVVMYAGQVVEHGLGGRHLQAAAPSLHLGPVRVAAAHRRRRRAAHADPGHAAVAALAAERLPLPPALHLRLRAVPDPGAGARGRPRQRGAPAARACSPRRPSSARPRACSAAAIPEAS